MPKTLILEIHLLLINMQNILNINNKIKPFNKKIITEGDKSLSIRWALLSSQAIGKSTAYNILKSEDVLNTLNCLKKLGVKVKLYKNRCEIIGLGINKFIYKKILIKSHFFSQPCLIYNKLFFFCFFSDILDLNILYPLDLLLDCLICYK